MTAKRRRLVLQVLAVQVALLFAAGDAFARGGRGGGGRGGGGGRSMGGRSMGYSGGSRASVYRGGPASRGMGSVSRAQRGSTYGTSSRATAGTRDVTRPSTGTRPSAGTGDRQQGRTDRVADREQGRTERQGSREEAMKDRQDDRQDWADSAREDRQDFWDNQIEDIDWDEVDWDEWEVHDDFEWSSGTWLVLGVGTAVTIGAWNTMVTQPGCNLERLEVNGQMYFKCGSTWYIEAWTGDQVHYVAVESPV